MDPRKPSRRSLLSVIGGLLAWLCGPRPAQAAPATPAPEPPAPASAPQVVRIPDLPALPRAPQDACVLEYSAYGLPQGLATDPTHGGTYTRMSYTSPGYLDACAQAQEDAGGQAAIVHAASRLESPSGEFLGREEYEVVIRDGKRFVRVAVLDAAGNAAKTGLVPF